MPFLTLEDPNAKIKGSRDALGVLPIWSAFGRHVVPNLTTQTDSVRGFTILLLGRYFGGRLIEDAMVQREDALDVALRMEELGAHVRHHAHDVTSDIRGIERVRRFQQESRSKTVHIQADPRGFILSDQKVNGLWGLYSVSARTSGLLPDGSVGVTAAAREFIETNYLPRLEGCLPALLKMLARGGRLRLKGAEPVYRCMADVLSKTFTPAEVEFYRHHLIDAEATDGVPAGRQATLRELLQRHTDLEDWFNRDEALKLVRAARDRNEELTRSFERIVTLESLLAPAAHLFDYVLVRTGRRPEELAEKIRELWGAQVPNLDAEAFRDLLPEIREHSTPEIAREIAGTHVALDTGDYVGAVGHLMTWNAHVMAGRKAAPWVRLEHGKVDVRYSRIEHVLPGRDRLDSLWLNGYFVDSLKSLIHQLGRVA